MTERMLDKGKMPSAEEMVLFCGENGGRFTAINAFLSSRYGTSQEIRFPYGNKYGWCITHRRGKKLICDIFAEADAFCVMVRLSDRQFAMVYANVRECTKACIDSRYPCADGGWIHYRVQSDEDLNDIEALLSAKCE